MEQENDHHEPEPELPETDPGFFSKVNNYVLLVYAAACYLMYISISWLFVIYKMPVPSLSLPGIAGFVFPLFILSSRFSLKFTKAYRLKIPDARTSALSILISGGLILPVETLTSILESKWPPADDYIRLILSFKPKGILSFIAIAFGLVIVTPLGEELLFRGFIQRIFQRNMRGSVAVVLAAVLFGVLHSEPVITPAVICLGLIFGYLFLRTENLFYPVLGHAVYNLVSLLRLHLTPEETIKTSGFASPSPIWTVASAVVLVLGILWLERSRSPAKQAREQRGG